MKKYAIENDMKFQEKIMSNCDIIKLGKEIDNYILLKKQKNNPFNIENDQKLWYNLSSWR